MNDWTKRIVVAAAALLLTGCLWGPGKFVSDLTLRKDGSFSLDYRGEIVLQLPPDEQSKALPWKSEFARCYRDREPEIIDSSAGAALAEVDKNASGEGPGNTRRNCTAAEVAKLKAQYEKASSEKAAAKLKDNVEMAKMFGLPGLDDESNRAFAAKLMKYAGWRSVAYRGNGVFDVDYHLDGRATQDFLFPALPDNNLLVPFIALRRRADGSVLVTAPAFTGGAGPMGAGLPAGEMAKGPTSRAQGRFTVVTDGEILTNNSEEGPTANPLGRQVRWDVGPGSTKIPETLIHLR